MPCARSGMACPPNGRDVNVEFNVLKDPQDASRDLAIDVAQNIDGEWVVQTVQQKAGEADPVIGIEGLGLDQLVELAGSVVDSLTTEETRQAEMHLVLKRISPETSEIHGHIVTPAGERSGVRANYRHYYVLNAILEKMAAITRETYSGLELHRDRDDQGRVYFRFVKAR